MQILPLDIAGNHPAYAGHFPGMPITPGVVLLDEAIHAIAIQENLSLTQCRIGNAKFLKPVLPGTPMQLQYEIHTNGNISFQIKDHEQEAVATGAFNVSF